MRDTFTAPLPSNHPAPLTPTGEQTLSLADRNRWLSACCWAAKDENLVPGHTEVSERCDAIPTEGLQLSRYAFRTTPDRWGRPRARRILLAGEPLARRVNSLTIEVRTLLDRLESSVESALPLHVQALSGVRHLAEAEWQGQRCVILGAERNTDGLAFEFRLWLDARHGYARRIDYRARGLPAPVTGIATASAVGSRTYRLDESDRWLLVEHRARLTFWSVATDLPARGFAERTSTHRDYWQSAPARRATAGAPDDPGLDHPAAAPAHRPPCVLPAPARSGTSAPAP